LTDVDEIKSQLIMSKIHDERLLAVIVKQVCGYYIKLYRINFPTDHDEDHELFYF